MTTLKIHTGENNPILRKKSVEVVKITGKMKKFFKDLKETMITADGLGLAAPQVGENIRAIAINMNSGTTNRSVVLMINPVIIWKGNDVYVAEEGCLSLPEIFMEVERNKEIIVEYQDPSGENKKLKLDMLNARIVQHEVDHLDGILFVDRVKKS
jgi:peptide deformylase